MALPDPPVPSSADLRDFDWMPIDVKRLRDSTLATKPAEIFRVATLSWCVAWHQLPAGSLPACDRELSYLLGFGSDLRRWKRLRAAGALHGWSLCSDGRLYHQTVAEKVVEALKSQEKRLAEAERLRKYREQKRQNSEAVHVRDLYENSTRTHTRTDSEPVRDSYGTCRPEQTRTDHDQTVLREESGLPQKRQPRLPVLKPGKPEPPQDQPEFAELCKIYPAGKLGNRARCAELFRLATCPPRTAAEAKKVTAAPVQPAVILEGAQQWYENKWRTLLADDFKFEVNLERWLTERRWEDAPKPRPGKMPPAGWSAPVVASEQDRANRLGAQARIRAELAATVDRAESEKLHRELMEGG